MIDDWVLFIFYWFICLFLSTGSPVRTYRSITLLDILGTSSVCGSNQRCHSWQMAVLLTMPELSFYSAQTFLVIAGCLFSVAYELEWLVRVVMWGNMRKKRGCFIVNCYLGLGAEGGEFRDVIILFLFLSGGQVGKAVFGCLDPYFFFFFFRSRCFCQA